MPQPIAPHERRRDIAFGGGGAIMTVFMRAGAIGISMPDLGHASWLQRLRCKLMEPLLGDRSCRTWSNMSMSKSVVVATGKCRMSVESMSNACQNWCRLEYASSACAEVQCRAIQQAGEDKQLVKQVSSLGCGRKSVMQGLHDEADATPGPPRCLCLVGWGGG